MNANIRKRVVIAERHPVIAEGIANVYREHKGFKVVAKAQSPRDMLEMVVLNRPDLLIVDPSLAQISMEGLLPIFKRLYPEMCIIIIAVADFPAHWQKMIALGLDGLMHKAIHASQLIEGSLQVIRGEKFIDSSIKELLDMPNSGVYVNLPKNITGKLTRRENEILVFSINKLTAKQIASRLGISSRTVSKHRENIYKTLGVNSIEEAVYQLQSNVSMAA